jgi:SagB-type dehydrogenase family enzyme
MTKLAWVALPIIAYAAYAGVAALRGRAARHALNMHTSLLLMVYLLTTAGLGLFWVANQQLPVFDLHYLFGYATLVLVAVHLFFNLPLVIKHLRRRPRAEPRPARHLAPQKLLIALGVVGALVGSFALGARHGEKQAPAYPALPSATPLGLIERYHAISSTSRGGILAEGPNVDWGARPPALKSYPGAETLALQPARPLAGRPLDEALRRPAPAGELDLAALGAVLFFAAGITERRGGLDLRASPSSGALFPTELYLVVQRVAGALQATGLAPGVYHYDPGEHRLHVIGGAVPTFVDAAPAAVVVTSIFRRTGFKYRDRAYRYATADAGHLLANLRLAAAEAGLDAAPVARFDEAEVAAAIGVDGVEEGVLALLPIAPRPSATGLPSAPATPLARLVPAEPPEATPLGATGLVHAATSLAAPPVPDGLVALPAPAPLPRPALEVVASRRSHRRFSDRPIAAPQLAAMMAAATAPPALSTAVRAHLVVNRVEGLPPGAYRHHPEAGGLTLTRAGDLGAAAGAAALDQEVIGGAAAVLVLSVDRRALAAEGARGYRHAFLEAGMFSERWLLAAAAQDLGACPVGAFYDEEAAALIGVDPAAEWVIHFAAVGEKS